MLKSLLSSLLLVATAMLPAQAQLVNPNKNPIMALDSSISVPYFSTFPPSSEDPLGSPYPIPWAWILQTQADYEKMADAGRLLYYRTPSLVSPDGHYGVYARIAMQVKSQLFESSVSTVLFIEDLQTGKLQTIRPPKNLALTGNLSILMPVSWSDDGSRLLLRQLEGSLSTSDATDSAVIWERSTRHLYTLTPQNIDYDIAILLGWSPSHREQVLFRAGFLGDEIWPVWSVNLKGETVLSESPPSSGYGEREVFSWTGSQSLP